MSKVPLWPTTALTSQLPSPSLRPVSLTSHDKFHTTGKVPFDAHVLLLVHLYTVYVVVMKFSVCSHGI